MAFVCKHCESITQIFTERCSRCCRWGTLAIAKATLQHRHLRMVHGAADEEDEEEDEDEEGETELATGPVRLDRVKGSRIERIKTGIAPFDRILGGGMVRGFVYLLAGDPGAGKSTLTLQIAGSLAEVEAESGKGGKGAEDDEEPDEPGIAVYYAAAEEDERRIKNRAKRLGVSMKHCSIWYETDVNAHFDTEEFEQADVVIYDSLQELTDPSLRTNVAKSILSNIKEQAEDLGHVALVISQLTKDGKTAGPNSIEHRGDVTIDLMLVDENTPERVIRIRKNRGGPSNKSLSVVMTENGIDFASARKRKRK